VDFAPGVESCEQVLDLILLDNAALESGFSDRCTVKRIVGGLWVKPLPDYASAGTPDDLYTGLNSGTFHAHLGLLRKPLGHEGPVTPLSTGKYFPHEEDFSLSEAEWLKTWQHMWSPADGIPGYELTAVAPDTSSQTAVWPTVIQTCSAPDNVFADGNGTFCIETTTEESFCVPCDQQAGLASFSQFVSIPRWWHIPLDLKKSIPMREDQELKLELSLAHLTDSAVDFNWFIQFYAMIKILVEF